MLSRRGASDAGRLRLQLTLERATRTADGAGGATLMWNAIATLAADIAPIKADESEVGEGLADLTLQKIVVRKRDDISAATASALASGCSASAASPIPQEDGRYLACLCEEEGRP